VSDERLEEIKYWIGAHSPDVPYAVTRGAEDLLAEVERLRQERDYWREECRKRATMLWHVEFVGDEATCPRCRCQQHVKGCQLQGLAAMPEEPKS